MPQDAAPLRVFLDLHRAHATLFRAADRRMKREEGITTAQQVVLFQLGLKDGQSLSALADALNLGRPTLTGLIDRMSEAGLVRRAASAEDGRVQHVFLEKKGRGIVARSGALTRALNDALLAPFNAGERAVIARFLTRIADEAEAIVGQ